MIKPQRVDLHTHTIYSDGDDSPKIVVKICKAAGKRIIAITDHDTIKGIPEAIRTAKKCHIKILLPANAEFTSVYWDKIKRKNQTEHILGYCFDPRNSKLDKFFSSQEKSKQDYAEKVVNALTQFGFEISLDDVLRFVKGTISDVHIYKAIIENSQKKSKNARILRKNNVETFKNFNKLFLKGVIRFEKEKLPIKDIIKMIRDAGGYAVWAHPFWKKGTTIYNVQKKIENLQKWGLNGIETFYFRHSQAQTLKLHYIAQELSTNESPMYETTGSDYHSSNRAGELRRIGYIHTYGLTPNFFFPL